MKQIDKKAPLQVLKKNLFHISALLFLFNPPHTLAEEISAVDGIWRIVFTGINTDEITLHLRRNGDGTEVKGVELGNIRGNKINFVRRVTGQRESLFCDGTVTADSMSGIYSVSNPRGGAMLQKGTWSAERVATDYHRLIDFNLQVDASGEWLISTGTKSLKVKLQNKEGFLEGVKISEDGAATEPLSGTLRGNLIEIIDKRIKFTGVVTQTEMHGDTLAGTDWTAKRIGTSGTAIKPATQSTERLTTTRPASQKIDFSRNVEDDLAKIKEASKNYPEYIQNESLYAYRYATSNTTLNGLYDPVKFALKIIDSRKKLGTQLPFDNLVFKTDISDCVGTRAQIVQYASKRATEVLKNLYPLTVETRNPQIALETGERFADEFLAQNSRPNPRTNVESIDAYFNNALSAANEHVLSNSETTAVEKKAPTTPINKETPTNHAEKSQADSGDQPANSIIDAATKTANAGKSVRDLFKRKH